MRTSCTGCIRAQPDLSMHGEGAEQKLGCLKVHLCCRPRGCGCCWCPGWAWSSGPVRPPLGQPARRGLSASEPAGCQHRAAHPAHVRCGAVCCMPQQCKPPPASAAGACALWRQAVCCWADISVGPAVIMGVALTVVQVAGININWCATPPAAHLGPACLAQHVLLAACPARMERSSQRTKQLVLGLLDVWGRLPTL